MDTLFGMRVISHPLVQPVPVLQLHPNFKWCRDEFRAEMNAWLLDMFGTKEVAYIIGGNSILMHPKHIAMLRG